MALDTMSPRIPLCIFDIPTEILQKIVLCTILECNLGRLPRELYSCLLTCRAFNNALSPKSAGELYFLIFGQQFDIAGPIYRLGQPAVREQAPCEIRRRFQAIQIFRSRSLDHLDLTEALWIAYLMVEDTDTSQKNIKQLLGAHLPSFLDHYLRDRLYEDAATNDGWPVITEQNSLAIALSWTLASNSALSHEAPEVRLETMRRLEPIVFAASRYSIFHTPEASFTFSGIAPDTPPSTSPQSARQEYPISIIPPRNISYFGTIKRQARPPCAVIFATLLYFARSQMQTTLRIPSHITYTTREEATQAGYDGLTIADIKHFHERCGTHFANFPGLDVGVYRAALATSPDTILCQPSHYQLGKLSGQWQGTSLVPWRELRNMATSKPVYITLEEHFCYEGTTVVPQDDPVNGAYHAWLPPDIQAVKTKSGIQFFSPKGSFDTTYETYRLGVTNLRDPRRIADVIITGKTEEQYLTAWGGPPKIIGRVRLHDGLMVLSRYYDVGDPWEKEVMRGYVTSSQNLVGRIARRASLDSIHESVFSLGRDNAHRDESHGTKVS